MPSVQCHCYGFISLGELESGGSTDSFSQCQHLMVAGPWCTQGGEYEMGCLEGSLQMGSWLCMYSSGVPTCWYLVLQQCKDRVFQKLRGIQGTKHGHIQGSSPEESVSCTQTCIFGE